MGLGTDLVFEYLDPEDYEPDRRILADCLDNFTARLQTFKQYLP